MLLSSVTAESVHFEHFEVEVLESEERGVQCRLVDDAAAEVNDPSTHRADLEIGQRSLDHRPVPAGNNDLIVVSTVGGAGWTCNSVDPIECTYAPALAPGASAPTITVTVEVAETASGTAIVNVAEVIGAVDRDCASDRLTEAFEPACNEVTDDDDETTPLNPNADLAIVKTASVAQVGAGGGFDWVLEITNNGPGIAVNVEIGDIVPSQLSVTGVTSSDFSCSNSGNTVTCTKASMAAPGSRMMNRNV